MAFAFSFFISYAKALSSTHTIPLTPSPMNRRHFLKTSSVSTASLLASTKWPAFQADEVSILNPRNRVPVSFIIDDSTALVNLAYYGIPQFGEVFPENYKQDWRALPREIPDSFVLEFLGWCADHGVKGKYSMVPFPACTGYLHRFIPGWTKQELEASLKIVREQAMPDWDIHSEMISHTRVIDIKTGLPFPDATPEFMENWEWSQTKSADELGEYIAYSLQILKDAGFDCDGVTTPGGFGGRNIPNLARGTQYAVREVFGHNVAHFFRDVVTEPDKSVQPQIFHAEGLEGADASCSVHIIACTGDWFGGWDGLTPGDPDRFITEDGKQGRLVEVIEQEEPAIFICHWPGIYYNGEKLGFDIFKTVVNRLHATYDHLHWMKLTDIAHYWAARTFAKIALTDEGIVIESPFATKDFTLEVARKFKNPVLYQNQTMSPLNRVSSSRALTENSWCKEGKTSYVCLNLEAGITVIKEG